MLIIQLFSVCVYSIDPLVNIPNENCNKVADKNLSKLNEKINFKSFPLDQIF